ncbi:MAG: HAD family phosphatase [Clostridiales bacterium]|nr:HAD family phosphatase [Clostridiales bacterium]
MSLPYRLAAFDLDGTLFNDEKKITPWTIKVLNQCFEKQMVLVPCTGRVLMAVPEFVRKNHIFQYFITSNGAMIYDKEGTVMYQKTMDKLSVRRILSFLESLDVMIEIFVDGKAYTEEKNFRRLEEFKTSEFFIPYVLSSRHPIDSYRDFISHTEHGLENLNIIFRSQMVQEEILTYLKTETAFEVTSSYGNNIEIGAKGVNKGEALTILAEKLSVPMNQTIAFGDNHNDISMFLKAGFSVAMKNGEEEAKKAAHIVTESNNEEGVARILENYLVDTK